MSSVLKFIRDNHILAIIESAIVKKKTRLSLNAFDITEIPSLLYTCYEVEHLYLHRNKIITISVELTQLLNLTTLTLDYNNISSLPPEIGSLKNLVNLNLSYNPLQVLIPEIGELENLEAFWCNRIGLREIPKEIGNLSKLDTFGARGNHLKTIPEEMTKLSKLRWLTLEHNEIESLPSTLGGLEALVHCNLRHNCLRQFPMSVLQCGELMFLQLNDNQISSFPEDFDINSLQVLEMIDVRNNPICELDHPKHMLIRYQEAPAPGSLSDLASSGSGRHAAALAINATALRLPAVPGPHRDHARVGESPIRQHMLIRYQEAPAPGSLSDLASSGSGRHAAALAINATALRLPAVPGPHRDHARVGESPIRQHMLIRYQEAPAPGSLSDLASSGSGRHAAALAINATALRLPAVPGPHRDHARVGESPIRQHMLIRYQEAPAPGSLSDLASSGSGRHAAALAINATALRLPAVPGPHRDHARVGESPIRQHMLIRYQEAPAPGSLSDLASSGSGRHAAALAINATALRLPAVPGPHRDHARVGESPIRQHMLIRYQEAPAPGSLSDLASSGSGRHAAALAINATALRLPAVPGPHRDHARVGESPIRQHMLIRYQEAPAPGSLSDLASSGSGRHVAALAINATALRLPAVPGPHRDHARVGESPIRQHMLIRYQEAPAPGSLSDLASSGSGRHVAALAINATALRLPAVPGPHRDHARVGESPIRQHMLIRYQEAPAPGSLSDLASSGSGRHAAALAINATALRLPAVPGPHRDHARVGESPIRQHMLIRYQEAPAPGSLSDLASSGSGRHAAALAINATALRLPAVPGPHRDHARVGESPIRQHMLIRYQEAPAPGSLSDLASSGSGRHAAALAINATALRLPAVPGPHRDHARVGESPIRQHMLIRYQEAPAPGSLSDLASSGSGRHAAALAINATALRLPAVPGPHRDHARVGESPIRQHMLIRYQEAPAPGSLSDLASSGSGRHAAALAINATALRLPAVPGPHRDHARVGESPIRQHMLIRYQEAPAPGSLSDLASSGSGRHAAALAINATALRLPAVPGPHRDHARVGESPIRQHMLIRYQEAPAPGSLSDLASSGSGRHVAALAINATALRLPAVPGPHRDHARVGESPIRQHMLIRYQEAPAPGSLSDLASSGSGRHVAALAINATALRLPAVPGPHRDHARVGESPIRQHMLIRYQEAPAPGSLSDLASSGSGRHAAALAINATALRLPAVPGPHRDHARVAELDLDASSVDSSEDWENSVNSSELDVQYQSEEERADNEAVGMVLPELSRYASTAS